MFTTQTTEQVKKRNLLNFSRRFEGLKEKFENIYLIRNEREIKIFDKLGEHLNQTFFILQTDVTERNDISSFH
jgi:hypothetical protein